MSKEVYLAVECLARYNSSLEECQHPVRLSIVILIFILTVVLIGLWLWIRGEYSKAKPYVQLRLENYSRMLGNKPDAYLNGVLTGDQHRVLLGVLKKIEAKNGNLARLWTFSGAGCIALMKETHDLVMRGLLVLTIIYIVFFVVASLDGNRQVDQLASSSKDRAYMQNMLIDDMLRKEANFAFSKNAAFFLAVCLTAFAVGYAGFLL